MKKLFFLLLPLLAAAWLASLGGCGKCKGIEGKVLEFGTDKPIPNATVTLADCEGEILGNFSCTDLAYATTNSDGRFDFSEDGFAVSAKAPGYWDTGDDFIMVTNECPKPVLYLYPHAWLQVRVKNESGAYEFGHGNNILLQLPIGKDTVFTEFSRGNTDEKFVYHIQETQTDTTRTTLDDLAKVKIQDEAGGQIAPSLANSWSPWFKVFLKGHEITKITITY